MDSLQLHSDHTYIMCSKFDRDSSAYKILKKRSIFYQEEIVKITENFTEKLGLFLL